MKTRVYQTTKEDRDQLLALRRWGSLASLMREGFRPIGRDQVVEPGTVGAIEVEGSWVMGIVRKRHGTKYRFAWVPETCVERARTLAESVGCHWTEVVAVAEVAIDPVYMIVKGK